MFSIINTQNIILSATTDMEMNMNTENLNHVFSESNRDVVNKVSYLNSQFLLTKICKNGTDFFF